MTEPPSRQFEAYEANGWPNEVAEYDPHGVAAGGMYAGLYNSQLGGGE